MDFAKNPVVQRLLRNNYKNGPASMGYLLHKKLSSDKEKKGKRSGK